MSSFQNVAISTYSIRFAKYKWSMLWQNKLNLLFAVWNGTYAGLEVGSLAFTVSTRWSRIFGFKIFKDRTRGHHFFSVNVHNSCKDWINEQTNYQKCESSPMLKWLNPCVFCVTFLCKCWQQTSMDKLHNKPQVTLVGLKANYHFFVIVHQTSNVIKIKMAVYQTKADS